MTKTLTEQWKDGELPDGNYYFKLKDGTILSGCQAITDGVFRCEYADFYKRVKEVLAPVPSYDKVKEMSQKIERLEFDNEVLEMVYKQLEKKLEIATKALKKLTRDCNKWGIARETLKEMEGVK